MDYFVLLHLLIAIFTTLAFCMSIFMPVSQNTFMRATGSLYTGLQGVSMRRAAYKCKPPTDSNTTASRPSIPLTTQGQPRRPIAPSCPLGRGADQLCGCTRRLSCVSGCDGLAYYSQNTAFVAPKPWKNEKRELGDSTRLGMCSKNACRSWSDVSEQVS